MTSVSDDHVSMRRATGVHLLALVALAQAFSPTDPIQLGVSPPTAPDGGRPWFQPDASENVTALLGRTAYLTCRVRSLGNRTVSWVRLRDVHLLTVGENTYTSDERFRARHAPSTHDWTLQVKFVQHRDTGMYACQVSTSPPVSYPVHLTVVEPVTEILGGPELFIDTESTINLTCVVRQSPEPPSFIFWKHNDKVISYDSVRGGVSVVTIKGAVTASSLLIQRARPSDSGRYSCQPSGAAAQSLRVHVLQGEKPAAMQTGGSPELSGQLTAVVVSALQLLAWNQLA